VPSLDRQGDVFVLDLGDGENRFHPDWLAAVNALLDKVEQEDGPRALVTSATGKFWSNGLDLDWLGSNLDQSQSYVGDVQSLFATLLTLPVPTVAAIQGHCFAAGAMLALAHDWRTMRDDRGFFCLPEVDIGIPFTGGMDTLIRAKLPIATALAAMTTGHRYGGAEAAAVGIVTSAVAADDVVSGALELAAPLAAKAGPTLGTIKARMFASVVASLADVSDARIGH
jgi:Delta3-Delta2-enoyl-CoA isomerase